MQLISNSSVSGARDRVLYRWPHEVCCSVCSYTRCHCMLAFCSPLSGEGPRLLHFQTRAGGTGGPSVYERGNTTRQPELILSPSSHAAEH